MRLVQIWTRLEPNSSPGLCPGSTDTIHSFELKDQGNLITEEALSTSAIEGELLDRDSIRSSVARRLGLPISRALFLGQYFRSLSDIHLRERQLKVLKKMLKCYPEEFQGGLTNRKYAAMAKVSPETAKRDLKEMVDKGVIIPGTAGGRSVHYLLNRIPGKSHGKSITCE